MLIQQIILARVTGKYRVVLLHVHCSGVPCAEGRGRRGAARAKRYCRYQHQRGINCNTLSWDGLAMLHSRNQKISISPRRRNSNSAAGKGKDHPAYKDLHVEGGLGFFNPRTTQKLSGAVDIRHLQYAKRFTRTETNVAKHVPL